MDLGLLPLDFVVADVLGATIQIISICNDVLASVRTLLLAISDRTENSSKLILL